MQVCYSFSEKSLCLFNQLSCTSILPQQISQTGCRWRFTKSREGKRGGPFVKVNHWPSLVVSRQNGFGWRMEVRACAVRLPGALLGGETCHAKESPQKPSSSAHTLYVMHGSLLNDSCRVLSCGKRAERVLLRRTAGLSTSPLTLNFVRLRLSCKSGRVAECRNISWLLDWTAFGLYNDI